MNVKMPANVPVIETALTDEPTRLNLNYHEYLEQIDEDMHAEWVNGEVIIYMPPKDIHQSTLGFLYELLSLYVRLFSLGKLRIAPFEVKLKPGGSSREPDIIFIARENLKQLTEDRLVGPPDLAIEIVSASSVGIDRKDKFEEYLEAGVREYWIIDPRPGQLSADFFQRDESGNFNRFATQADRWVTSSIVAGFSLRPSWLWQVDALDPLTCALEIKGVAAALAEQIRLAQSDEFEDIE